MNIVEGIGAMIGTYRVKRQQQEIDRIEHWLSDTQTLIR